MYADPFSKSISYCSPSCLRLRLNLVKTQKKIKWLTKTIGDTCLQAQLEKLKFYPIQLFGFQKAHGQISTGSFMGWESYRDWLEFTNSSWRILTHLKRYLTPLNHRARSYLEIWIRNLIPLKKWLSWKPLGWIRYCQLWKTGLIKSSESSSSCLQHSI